MTGWTIRPLMLLAALVLMVYLASIAAVSSCSSEPYRELEPELESVQAYRGPQWARGGQSLVFEYDEKLYIVEVDRTRLSRFPLHIPARDDFEIDVAPNVSPDGDRLAFTTMRYRTGSLHSFEIATVDIDGRNDERLTDIEWLDTNPVWSPDGERIAFFSDRGNPDGHRGHFHLYVMASDGANPQRVSPDGSANPAPAVWSPQGDTIAYWGTTPILSDGNLIYVCALLSVNADGSDFTLVSQVPCLRNSAQRARLLPTWAPDGQRIAFISQGEGPEGLFVATRDGSDVRKIADLPAASPIWLPDGSSIVYLKDNTLWAVSPDDPSSTWEVSNELVRPSSYLTLSPDGSRIAVYNPGFRSAQHAWLKVIGLDGTATPVLLEKDFEAFLVLSWRQ